MTTFDLAQSFIEPTEGVKMRKHEVEEKIGKENWNAFDKWMGGQTVGIYPDGHINYYTQDVEAFVIKLKTGYDRQEDPNAWD